VVKASVWLKAIEAFRKDIFIATQDAWKGRKIDGVLYVQMRPNLIQFLLIQ
jgi:mannose-1-phosphate guanylyltransferase/mannose-6-phosphate isomerase